MFEKRPLDDELFRPDFELNIERVSEDFGKPRDAIKPSDDWLDRIWRALRGCRLCVFLATPYSLKSLWCQLEVGAAMALNKKLFTVRWCLQHVDLFEPLDRLQQMEIQTRDDLARLVDQLVDLAQPGVD